MSLQFINMRIQKFFKFFCSLLFLQKEMLRGQGSREGYIWGGLKEERQISRGAQSLFKSSYSQEFFSPDMLSNTAALNEITYLKLNSLYQCNAVSNETREELNHHSSMTIKSSRSESYSPSAVQGQHNYHETYLKHTPLICKANGFHLKVGNSKKLK